MNEQLKISLWIALGGSLGTLARFALNVMFGAPGTIVVNVLATFLLAALAGWAATRMLDTLWTQYGLGVGFCGAFSTMSTLTADTFILFSKPSPLHAALYLSTSLALGLLAAFAGFAFGQRFFIKQTASEKPPLPPEHP